MSREQAGSSGEAPTPPFKKIMKSLRKKLGMLMPRIRNKKMKHH